MHAIVASALAEKNLGSCFGESPQDFWATIQSAKHRDIQLLLGCAGERSLWIRGTWESNLLNLTFH